MVGQDATLTPPLDFISAFATYSAVGVWTVTYTLKPQRTNAQAMHPTDRLKQKFSGSSSFTPAMTLAPEY